MTEMKFAFPRDGVMLSPSMGKAANGKLLIYPIVNALPGRNLTVNGVPMIFDANMYTSKSAVELVPDKNTLTLKDTDTGEIQAIDVFYLPNAAWKYRFSLDDNIWFLQNLAKNQNIYKSMFEDPYLTLLKTMHDRYDTKFHVNIYYECPEFGGFNLTMMPDKYKDEFKANADWLRLSCHANANLPDRPYIQATYNQAYFEFNRVNEHIIRFAGEEAFAGPVTTIHWGEATTDTVRGVYDAGIRMMVGSFKNGTISNTDIAYNFTSEQSDLMRNYGLYYDKATDMKYFLYSQSGIQHAPIADIPMRCKHHADTHPGYTFFELCVHEQYFYPHYSAYKPDYYERFDTALRWVTEHGYKPCFAKEAFSL